MDSGKKQSHYHHQHHQQLSGGGGGFSEGSYSDADNIMHESLSASVNSNLMSTSQISTASSSNAATEKSNFNITHHSSGVSARFPKLEECAHFHYERVQLGRIHIRLVDEKNNDCSSSLMNETSSNRAPTASDWFIMKISAGRSDPFFVRRSFENLQLLDSMLHRCVYDRRISELRDLCEVETRDEEALEDAVTEYLAKFSSIASDTITCGSILTWLQLDNKGRRLPVADRDTMRTINTPAVGAAYGVRRYLAQACDEISIEVGDMISVIDMPSPAESVWWRGKKSHLQKNQYEVGFFPQNCVAIIGEKVPRNMPLPAPLVGSLALSPTKPVLRKHGKLISFFRSFILARPSRRRLKQSGIYKERVFSCDLSEHLLNSQQDIPLVLKHCAEFIENFGIVDGIYRLSGITSTIQKLRRAFDEERVPDLTGPEFRHDIHAISSLLKMYFRELPNPLCTYQLYDEFVEAIQAKVDNAEQRLILIKKVVQKLPPPHYRTLKYLAMHLFKISRYSESTGMTERNIAIVWAPNLLRSPALESGGVAALKGVGVQAVVTEYLISKCEDIFDDSYIPEGFDSQPESLSSLNSVIGIDEIPERPKSLNVSQGAKLITLEEAQIKQNRVSLESKSIPITASQLPAGCTSYIEVGGGPSSLPDKYHTILPMPKNKRKPNSIMSLFYRPKQSTNNVIDSVTPEETKADLQETKSPEPEIKSPQIEYKRSNSIDSLRTHSRSVSHDSYFDLLQSPLRAMVCPPSRELSELGMNFDREEPEMRIFSEAESLVSSPKVKDGRRTKIRLEDVAVSINPSPKKQPRLNIPTPSPVEETSGKKFEEELSDLQYIDSPEHNPDKEEVQIRYSYPNYDRATTKRDERFSLPSPTQMTIDTVDDATKLSPITPTMGYSLLIGSCSTVSKQEKSESESELTPSDIGYQVQKDDTPRSDFDIYDYMKAGLEMSPIKSPASPPSTPVRATIQITYNIKEPSPCRTETNEYEEVLVKSEPSDKKGLLETTFDDTIVYEQVKFLKSAVSELNELINDEQMDTTEQQVPDNKTDSDDPMTTCEPEDSLEYDPQVSMYENVQHPKPKAVYENVKYTNADEQKIDHKYADKEVEYSFEVPHKLELKTQSTSVRQLATKFETSPVDITPPFDFKPLQRQPSTPTKVKKEAPPLTRSLDENAFVREFGSARRANNTGGILIENNVSRRKSGGEKTLNQPKKLPGLRSNSSANNNEYCKIQFDNQRKMPPIPPAPTKITPTTENRISLIQQNFELNNVGNNNNKSNNNKPTMRYFDSIPKASQQETTTPDIIESPTPPPPPSPPKMEEEKPITPTTPKLEENDDEKNLSSISSVVLSTCKLDRDRIEKIKEERRHQLNEKFRSESFKTSSQVKSKSRPDVRDLGNLAKEMPAETQSLRIKSKSRTELSSSKLSIAEPEAVSLRTRRNSESRPTSTTTVAAKESNQTKDNTLVLCDKTAKVELRRTKPVDIQSRRSADYRNCSDKHKSTDNTGSDRMSIKDVAAMFESKSQNY